MSVAGVAHIKQQQQQQQERCDGLVPQAIMTHVLFSARHFGAYKHISHFGAWFCCRIVIIPSHFVILAPGSVVAMLLKCHNGAMK